MEIKKKELESQSEEVGLYYISNNQLSVRNTWVFWTAMTALKELHTL